MHIEKDHETGGHWCAKLIFFITLGVLLGVVALIVLESRSIKDMSPGDAGETRFSQYFEGWVEEVKDHDDDHGHSPYDVVHDHEDEHTFEEDEIGKSYLH